MARLRRDARLETREARVIPMPTRGMLNTLLFLTLSSVTLDCVAGDGPTTVPMQLLGNFPVITVKIEGNDVPLTFDLGDASALVLQQSVIDQLKTIPASETHRAKDVMGNVSHSVMFKVPRVQIGSAVFTDVTGRPDIHDPTYQATQVGQRGYLGTSLFKLYKVVLDYQHRRMTLMPPDSTEEQSAACKGTVVPFLPAWHGEPVTKGHTDFGDMTLVWDTGAPSSLIRKSRYQQAGGTVAEGSVTTKHLILGGVDFGSLEFTEFEYSEPVGSDAFVGYNFFAKHVVCIDFPGNHFRIQQ
jgi:hypothetical protein